MGFRDLKLRLRALITPSLVERDPRDELSFHIEREAKRLMDQGMQPDEARAQARGCFGSTTVVADECRDERGTAFVDNTIRDVRFALRSFRRAPEAHPREVAGGKTGAQSRARSFDSASTRRRQP